MNRIFISYSRADAAFVRDLSEKLRVRGAEIWLDEKNIMVGDSITGSIEAGLLNSDFLCLILSKNSVSRPWVLREYRTAVSMQLSSDSGRPAILPIVIENVAVPVLLRDIRFADFRTNPTQGFEDLARTLKLPEELAPYLSILDYLRPYYSGVLFDVSRSLFTIAKSWYELESLYPRLHAETERAIKELSLLRQVTGTDNSCRVLFTEPIRFFVEINWDYARTELVVAEGLNEFIRTLFAHEDELRMRRIYILPGCLEWHADGGEAPVDLVHDFRKAVSPMWLQ